MSMFESDWHCPECGKPEDRCNCDHGDEPHCEGCGELYSECRCEPEGEAFILPESVSARLGRAIDATLSMVRLRFATEAR